MSGTLRVICISLLLIAFIIPITNAAQASDRFELGVSANMVRSGEMVTFTVKGASLTDVYGAEIGLVYDTEKLQYTGYSNSLGDEAFVLEPKVSNDNIRLVLTLIGQRPGLSGDRNLLTLSFKALGTGSASVSLDSLTVLNSSKQLLPAAMGKEARVAVTPAKTNSDSDSITNIGIPSNNTRPASNASKGVVTLEALPSDQGVASVNVNPNDLLVAARQSENKAIRINVKNTSEVRKLQINLPTALPQFDQSGKVDTIQIQSDLGTISIASKFFNGKDVSEPSSLQLTVAKVNPATLSPQVKQRIGSSTVYDFNLSLNGKNLTRFEEEEIKIELPYTLAPGENSNQVVIYYIAEDGQIEVVKNGGYKLSTGMVEFRPRHFSQYAPHFVQVLFRDMDGFAWAEEAINGLAAREVVQGRDEGWFVPKGDVTRAEFAQMLVSLFDLSAPSAVTDLFDVDPSAWYYRAIASAQAAGLVKGKEDGSFGVNETISREDMAVLIYRIAQYLKVTAVTDESVVKKASFLDQQQTSQYAREAVTAVMQAGLMNGVKEGYFEPKGSSTRAQAATVLYRLFQLSSNK
jgi:hypothetical protein